VAKAPLSALAALATALSLQSRWLVCLLEEEQRYCKRDSDPDMVAGCIRDLYDGSNEGCSVVGIALLLSHGIDILPVIGLCASDGGVH